MKLRIVIVLGAAAVLIAAVILVSRHQPRGITMLLTNGVVYTVNPSQPRAEAIAIDKGLIVGVGATKDLLERFKPDTVLDLQGKPVYPGFIDSHAHLEELGAFLLYLNLRGLRSPELVTQMVARAVMNRPEGVWIRGNGWDQNLWPGKRFPTKSLLDAVSPHHPVMLRRIDGHAVWANSLALRVAKITRATRDPDGGRILRGPDGEPTGVLVDKAVDLLISEMPQPTRDERKEAVVRAVDECLKVGLTQVHDMGADSEMISIYQELIEKNDFPFRVYVAINGLNSTWLEYLKSGPDKGDAAGRLTVRALKLYMDGALGSRGAALLEPYADDPGNRGLTMFSVDSLAKIAALCIDNGFQLCVHAIGDRASGIVLSAYEKAFDEKRVSGNDLRFRIEHAEVLDPVDVKRFHRLGVLPMMQPTHCTSDMPWIADRLGKSRLAEASVWRSLLDDGNIIPAGSDFPFESPDPLLGIYAAITRKDLSGQPDSGWFPEQRMHRDEALKAFTLWGSYAAYQEDQKGSIEVGKWADLVILNKDIMRIDPPEIPRTFVEKTMVGGVFVYEASSGSPDQGK
ncbi:MAG: amidohydrolase [Bacteroidota bacterium]